MNRLFIIGNGFDRAHDLPTSYSHFIDDFWKRIKDNFQDNKVRKIIYVNEKYDRIFEMNPINSFENFIKNVKEYSEEYGYHYDNSNYALYTSNVGTRELIFNFKSNFFKRINIKKSILDWVDIENEYYDNLKEIVKSDRIPKEKKNADVKTLNQDFEVVKQLLETYLKKKVIDSFKLNDTVGGKWNSTYNFLRPISLFNNEHDLLKEFTNEKDREDLNQIFNKQNESPELKQTALYLVFNYTPSIEFYLRAIENASFNFELNYIHGKIDDENNPINFGFGDEMDMDYKLIENVDDNEYLKYFKSFQYSETRNYHKLLNYINSAKFQVCIMGHSCGLSDRTLLNTIFEHEYCRSIKVFYHDNDESDNYRDIIQNISRHFDDKKKMREKLVPKVLSRPFPQDFKFEKK